MKLTHVEIKNYRSVFHDYDNDESFEMELGDGVNAITGPNNSGKSNVLRALALALDDDFEFDRALDMPSVFPSWSKPVVTLTFQVPKKGAPSREQTLLRRLEDYERAVNPKWTRARSYARRREVHLRATIEGADETRGERRRVFVVPGVGARQLASDEPVAVKAMEQFDKCVQFVLIRSGESLESLLRGRFREVLQTILRDELRAEFTEAEKSRSRYVRSLQDGVLASLQDRIASELADLFPEVQGVTLEPHVRGLEETLTNMRIQIEDEAVTDLADKGTGVRGGLIVAILQHLASTSRRSIVFAVEEPESFLHPAAQEALREDVESLTSRADVSLVMTTHSPYMVSREAAARVISLVKDTEGRTVVDCVTRGDEPMQDALGGLFRNSLIIDFLERSSSTVGDREAILVVEGHTDRSWLELAARRAGRPGLVEDLRIVTAGEGIAAGGGADLAVTQALTVRSMSTVPVAVLFDNDEPGQQAKAVFRRINTKTKSWGEKKFVFSYDMVIPGAQKSFPYEAEDLWPWELLEKFVATHGDDDVLRAKSKRPKPFGGWHFDLDPAAKEPLDRFLHDLVSSDDCALWVEMLECIRAGVGLD